MFFFAKDQQRRLLAAARRAYPREACGLLFVPQGDPSELRLAPTQPTWNTPASFRIKAGRIAELERERKAEGEALIGCYHTHVRAGAMPSKLDCQGAMRLGGVWLIYSIAARRAAIFQWSGTHFERQSLRLA